MVRAVLVRAAGPRWAGLWRAGLGAARLGLLIWLVACSRSERATLGGAANPAFAKLGAFEPLSPERRCQAKIESTLRQPALSPPARFEAERSEILARAKGAPVLMVREPERHVLSPEATALLNELASAKARATALFDAYPRIVRRESVAREVFLREGYLYADTPSLAFGMSHVVRLEDLFSAPRLWLQRGTEVFELRRVQRRGKPAYVVVGEPGAPERRARLLFLDRVALDPEALAEPLHRDLGRVRETLGFERARVRHVSANAIVLDAAYGEHVVPTLLMTGGADAWLDCEALAPEQREDVLRQRERENERSSLIAHLKAAIATQIDEALPFDEPRTEFGQEDGKLREAWLEAYRQGRSTYVYNDDRYWVFGQGGRPAVPQVCIDFIADSFERASGSWFAPRGARPEKTRGGVDFDELDLPSRRRVADFVAFAEAHPEWFELWRPERLVPLSGRRRFFDFIAEHRAQLRPGDIVVIYGMRDDGQPHYHSFFVFEADPLSGMPIHLASNAVLPQIRSWEGEMHNAPRRSIRVRIRPRSSWLAQILEGGTQGERAASAMAD